MTAARRSRRTPAVEVAIADGVAWVTLSRPQRRNRLDAEMAAALAEACEEVEHADDVRVVVLAGAGPTFSAGLPPGLAWLPRDWPDPVAAVAALTKPVIAALGGTIEGWGLSLALACDLRIAASTAVLRLPEAGRKIFPGGGVTQRLARLVGPARALEVVLLGEPIPAARAAAWGLVGQVVATRNLRAAVERLARHLAAKGPLALQLAKEAVLRALDLPLADGIRLEHDLYVLLQTTADRREGVASFLARRPPRFRGA